MHRGANRSRPILHRIDVLAVAALHMFGCGAGAASPEHPQEPANEAARSGNEVRTDPSGATVITNQGSTWEGHTPRGFVGKGTGLFIGDNINKAFPDHDAVQVYLTFDLRPLHGAPSRAMIRVPRTRTKGEPFRDLGPLVAQRFSYESFSKELALRSDETAEEVACAIDEGVLTCDVSDWTRDAYASDTKRLQVRIRFDKAGDGDGEPDVLYLTDGPADKNQAGLVELVCE